MTAIERVARTQRVLGLTAIVQAIAWGLAVTIGILALASVATLVIPSLAKSASLQVTIALLSGMVTAAALLWRARFLTSRNRVALWIEERIPSLNYSLITAIEHGGSEFSQDLERAANRENVSGAAVAASRKRLLPAIGALGVAALLLYISPSAAFGRGGAFFGSAAKSGAPNGPVGSRLERVDARVVPPGYTGQKASTLEDPTTIPALVGSRIVVSGKGSPEGISASISSNAVATTAQGDEWAVSFTMPAKPAALTLEDRQYDRIIVLDPHPDAPPRIVLTSPVRDTTLRVAQFVINLTATASDDIGLRGAYFEYLITSGSGEIFNARTLTTPIVGFDGARTGSIAAKLDLASLKLNQGDVVSIRAITQDGNALSGPGVATSDTRTFRIARADEYDSVAVDAAAPLPVDTAAVSQRMLIMRTEQLVREKPKISRKELVRRSGELGDLEDKIRKRVEEILYEASGGEEGGAEEPGAAPDPSKTLEGEESDQVHMVQNPDLYEAFNALWAAVRSLQIAEPDSALPPMRIALKALDRARLANRLYLRGMPPKVIVDVARVRMAGKEKGFASTRTPLSRTDSIRADIERRFGDAVELVQSKPAEAIRAFTLMQVQALSISPSLASALGEAIESFRKGKDATLPLLRARRALSGEPTGSPGLSPWASAR